MSKIVLALSLLMSGCTETTAAESAAEYIGVYESGFEISSSAAAEACGG